MILLLAANECESVYQHQTNVILWFQEDVWYPVMTRVFLSFQNRF